MEPKDSKEIIKEFLKANRIFDLQEDERLAAVAKLVSQIPFGEGRTIEDALVTKKVGTCQGKHLVLEACLNELGFEYKPVVCTFRWVDQSIKFPEKLRAILGEGAWEHGHNFVQVNVGGRYIDVDVTWDPRLAPYGFRSFPVDWDGKTSFVGLDSIVERWDNANMLWLKKKLIDSLTPHVRDRRQRFLRELFRWFKSI